MFHFLPPHSSFARTLQLPALFSPVHLNFFLSVFSLLLNFKVIIKFIIGSTSFHSLKIKFEIKLILHT